MTDGPEKVAESFAVTRRQVEIYLRGLCVKCGRVVPPGDAYAICSGCNWSRGEFYERHKAIIDAARAEMAPLPKMTPRDYAKAGINYYQTAKDRGKKLDELKPHRCEHRWNGGLWRCRLEAASTDYAGAPTWCPFHARSDLREDVAHNDKVYAAFWKGQAETFALLAEFRGKDEKGGHVTEIEILERAADHCDRAGAKPGESNADRFVEFAFREILKRKRGETERKKTRL